MIQDNSPNALNVRGRFFSEFIKPVSAMRGYWLGAVRSLIIGAIAGGCAVTSLASPSSPQVVSGQATFSQRGNVFSITNTPNTIINWGGFSIASGQIAQFNQQSASSSVLNRILGQDPSVIAGSLISNGRVYLINPNGIIFGSGSRVDVSSLVASTQDISNADFLAGRRSFSPVAGAGDIRNQGSLSTGAGGQVILIAPNVENTGVITSPQGEVVLAAGRTVLLAEPASPNLHVVLSAPADRVLNLGQIVTRGGAAGLYGALINQRGRVSADSAVVGQDGRIILKSSGDTFLETGSQTTATGVGRGGDIRILGERVGLTGDALVDASGQTGGGTVLVGGDYRGENTAVSNAKRTFLGSEASIRADAMESGNGGKVIVWSDEITRAFGRISARGGVNAGNGGLVETSGSKRLEFRAKVDVSAPRGQGGTLLLDPTDISLVGGTGDGAQSPDGSASFSGSATGQLLFADPDVSSGGVSRIYQSEIEGLSSGTSVILEATNSITAQGSFTGNKLTLPVNFNLVLQTRNRDSADRGSSSILPGIDLTGSAGGLTLVTRGTGAITVGTGSDPQDPAAVRLPGLLTAGGSVTITGGSTVDVQSIVTRGSAGTGGDISITAGDALTLNANLTAGSGAVRLSADRGPIQASRLAVISGQSLTAGAFGGISGEAGRPLRTAVAELDVRNVEYGDISISNTGTLNVRAVEQNGGRGNILVVNVGSMSLTGPAHSDIGAIELRAQGALSVNDSVSSVRGGAITLAAGTTGSSSDKLTISANVSTTGSITLNAGDAIVIGPLVVVSGGSVSQNEFLNGRAEEAPPLPSLNTCISAPLTPDCGAVLPSLTTCTASPATPGCTVILPTLAACVAAPTQAGCTVVLPALSLCTASPTTPGCSVVLPTLAACVGAPTQAGCTVVLPTLSSCTATPTTQGCSVVLPTLAACVGAPTQAGCTVVLPTLSSCTTAPTTPGCSVVLPTLAACVGAPMQAGCSVVLPSLSSCMASPATPGCSVVLPNVAACVATPTQAGCSVVLPPLSLCTASPVTPGCSVVLPALSACVVTPTLAGCTAVLPTLSACTASPAAPGCSVILPPLSACIATPTAPGCSVVLPPLASCIAAPALTGCSAVLPTLAICKAAPATAGCLLVLPPIQTQTTTELKTTGTAVTDTVCANLIPLTGTPSDKPKDDKFQVEKPKDATAISTKTGGTKDEPVKKLYCN